MTPTPDALLRAYSEHAAEYRLEVQMGWDRLRFFLALNMALFVFGRGAVQHCAGALASLLGAHLVRKTHRYYVNARGAFKTVERELGLDAFAMGTTPGMLGAPWLHSLKITTAGIVVLLVFVAFDVALAVLALLDL